MMTSQRRRLMAGSAIPVAVAAFGASMRWAMKRSLRPITRPIPHTPGDLGLAGTQVWLSGPRDKNLHGWWIPVRRIAPAVVVMHGWGANASLMLPFARPLHHAGYHTFFLDARGHGHSEADDYASMPRFAEDLDVALDWVSAHRRVGSVGVIGHSLGAGAAALALSRRSDVDAFVSVSGVADVWQVMAEHSALGRMPGPAEWAVRKSMEKVVGARFDEVAPMHTMGRITQPTMIVHGDRDEIVDLAHAYRLVEARGEAALHVIPGGSHGDLRTFEAHIGPVLTFLARHLGADKAALTG